MFTLILTFTFVVKESFALKAEIKNSSPLKCKQLVKETEPEDSNIDESKDSDLLLSLDLLVEKYLPLAKDLSEFFARKYSYNDLGIESDDFFFVAYQAIERARGKYQSKRENRSSFKTFLINKIKWDIKAMLRTAIRRKKLDRFVKVDGLTENHHSGLEYVPSRELSYDRISIHNVLPEYEKMYFKDEPVKIIEAVLDAAYVKSQLAKYFSFLEREEVKFLKLRYEDDLSIQEISEVLDQSVKILSPFHMQIKKKLKFFSKLESLPENRLNQIKTPTDLINFAIEMLSKEGQAIFYYKYRDKLAISNILENLHISSHEKYNQKLQDIKYKLKLVLQNMSTGILDQNEVKNLNYNDLELLFYDYFSEAGSELENMHYLEILIGNREVIRARTDEGKALANLIESMRFNGEISRQEHRILAMKYGVLNFSISKISRVLDRSRERTSKALKEVERKIQLNYKPINNIKQFMKKSF